MSFNGKMKITVELEEIEQPHLSSVLCIVRDDKDFDIGSIHITKNKLFVHDHDTGKFWGLSSRNLWAGYFESAHTK